MLPSSTKDLITKIFTNIKKATGTGKKRAYFVKFLNSHKNWSVTKITKKLT